MSFLENTVLHVTLSFVFRLFSFSFLSFPPHLSNVRPTKFSEDLLIAIHTPCQVPYMIRSFRR